MKIGINAIFLVPGKGGGLERYLRNVITHLQKLDKENKYIVFTNKDNSGTFDLKNNFSELCSPISARFRPGRILWEQVVFPKKINKSGIDLLFSPANISPLFISVPSVVVIHDLIPFVWPQNFDKIELSALKILFYLSAKRATKVLTVSNSSKNQIVEKFSVSAAKIGVHYGACDDRFSSEMITSKSTVRVREKYKITGDFILYTASTRIYKNIDRLLLALKLLKDKYKLAPGLVITGIDGRHHQKLLTTVDNLSLNNQVIFTGYVSEKELSVLYKEAQVFVYPSLYEGFGLPLVEAMTIGTPVAASNAASLPEVLGDAGLLFDPKNIIDITNTLYRVITDDGLRQRMIQKGSQRAKLFSWEKTARGLLETFNSINRNIN